MALDIDYSMNFMKTLIDLYKAINIITVSETIKFLENESASGFELGVILNALFEISTRYYCVVWTY